MKYLSELEFSYQMTKLEKRNNAILQKQKLNEVKHKYDKKKFKLTTTKFLTFDMFVMLNVILIYAMVAMWHFADISYLGVLVTDIAGQILTFKIYTAKSVKENMKGGITYEMAMNEMMNSSPTSETLNTDCMDTECDPNNAIG